MTLMTERVYEISEVLERLKELDGQRVCVSGLLTLAVENAQLSQGEARLWVTLAEGLVASLPQPQASYEGRQVIARGWVDARQTGPLGRWPAGLVRIDHLVRGGK